MSNRCARGEAGISFDDKLLISKKKNGIGARSKGRRKQRKSVYPRSQWEGEYTGPYLKKVLYRNKLKAYGNERSFRHR
jgi:hypothetical protein